MFMRGTFNIPILSATNDFLQAGQAGRRFVTLLRLTYFFFGYAGRGVSF